MARLTVEGTYEDGRVQLSSLPEGVSRARVRVTFLLESDSETRAAAFRELMAALDAAPDMGGQPLTREEVYEDRMARLEGRSD